MSNRLILSELSEARELENRREELTALEAKLAHREAELTNLKADFQSFETRYLAAVGVRYNELAEIEREIAKLQGLEIDDEAEGESLADDEVGCGQNRFHSDKLKKLYREVARKFHPDLAQCDQERLHRHQLMIEVNRAYETGAEGQLHELLSAGVGFEEIDGNGALSAEAILLARRIAEAKQRLAAFDSDIAEITSSETYKLKLRIENAEALGIDLLSDLISQVDRQILKAKNRLEHLHGVMLTG